MKLRNETLAIALMIMMMSGAALTGCAAGSEAEAAADARQEVVETVETEDAQEETETEEAGPDVITAEDITINEAIDDSEDGGHAISASGETASYSNIAVNKTGDSSGDEADFYGENAAVFAADGATLDLSEMVITTDGTHANAVFSYGSGTTVNISDSVIETTGNCSGGLMTTGGGTMNAENLNIHTTGNSSAAIRSDRGGGTVNVTGAINPDGQEGDVIVEIDSGSTWVLTGDSYITELNADAGSIDLNGYTLYVDGTVWN